MDFNNITDITASNLMPGDLAVTSDGVHVLIYIGADDWIEADPGERKVLILKTATEAPNPNSWLNLPVTLIRWRILAHTN